MSDDLIQIPGLGAMPFAEFKAWLKVPVSPVIPWLSDDELRKAASTRAGLEKVLAYAETYKQAVEMAVRDPLRYGYALDSWKRVLELSKTYNEIWCLGGNGSTKSWLGAWFGVKGLTERMAWERPSPAHEIHDVAFFHSSEDSSKDQQQAWINMFLPPEWRALGKSGNRVNVSYTTKNGFSDGKFILPNNARGTFFNYRQEVDVIVGYKWNLAVCDELVGLEFLREIRHRLRDRKGRLLVTFTPVEGFTPAVRDVLEGASVVEHARARYLPADRQLVPGCPPGHMPRLMVSRTGKQAILFLWSEDNPFNDAEAFAKTLDGEPVAEVKIRAYGYPEKLAGVAFPKFGPANVVPHDSIPAEGTDYLVCDPRPFKNWFMVWFRVCKQGRVYAVREWPDKRTHGEWALPSETGKPDGTPGPAQRSEAGRGFTAYKRLITELETAEGLSVFERVMDPRAGNSAVPGADEAMTVIDLMAEDHKDAEGDLPGMEFVVPGGSQIKQVKTLVGSFEEWLDWRMDQPLTPLNCPKFYVSERCENLRYALSTWTGLDGDKGATKDPVDCCRYLAAMDPCYVDPKQSRVSGGGSY